MAEKIKLSVEADKNAIYVYDETGSYDKSCNSGGWGSPNLEVSDIETTVSVEVIVPNSETAIIIDASAALPNSDGIGLEITASELGLDKIIDGFYHLTYRVKSECNEFEASFSVSKFFDANNACCIDKMIRKFNLSDISSDCNRKATEMEILLGDARTLACLGDISGAEKLTKHIALQCACCK